MFNIIVAFYVQGPKLNGFRQNASYYSADYRKGENSDYGAAVGFSYFNFVPARSLS